MLHIPENNRADLHFHYFVFALGAQGPLIGQRVVVVRALVPVQRYGVPWQSDRSTGSVNSFSGPASASGGLLFSGKKQTIIFTQAVITEWVLVRLSRGLKSPLQQEPLLPGIYLSLKKLAAETFHEQWLTTHLQQHTI